MDAHAAVQAELAAPALPRLAARPRRRPVPGLRRRLAVVRRPPRRVLGNPLALLRRSERHTLQSSAPRRADARRALVPRRDAQLRRARLPRGRPDPPGPGLRRRGRGAGRGLLGGAAPPGRRARHPPARVERRSRRPRRRLPPEHPARRRRDAGDCRGRRRVVLLRSGLRRPGRARPVRADRAEGLRRRRRIPLRRPDDRPARRDHGDPRQPAERRADGLGRLPVPGRPGVCGERPVV